MIPVIIHSSPLLHVIDPQYRETYQARTKGNSRGGAYLTSDEISYITFNVELYFTLGVRAGEDTPTSQYRTLGDINIPKHMIIEKPNQSSSGIDFSTCGNYFIMRCETQESKMLIVNAAIDLGYSLIPSADPLTLEMIKQNKEYQYAI